MNIFNARIKKSNVGNVKLDVISFVLQSKITKNIIFFKKNLPFFIKYVIIKVVQMMNHFIPNVLSHKTKEEQLLFPPHKVRALL